MLTRNVSSLFEDCTGSRDEIAHLTKSNGHHPHVYITHVVQHANIRLEIGRNQTEKISFLKLWRIQELEGIDVVEEALLGENHGSPGDEQGEAVGLGHILDGVALSRVESQNVSRVPGSDQLLELEPRYGHRLEHPIIRLFQHRVEIYWP